MKRLKFKSIQSRLTSWFLLLTLIPLLIILIITYFQRVNFIQSGTFNKLIAIRDLKSDQLNKWLDERKGDLKVMSGDFEVRTLENIFTKELKSDTDLEIIKISLELFQRIKENYDSYEEIFFISSKTGRIEISTNTSFIGENKSNNLYYKVPIETRDIYIKDIYYSKTLTKVSMTLSIPVFGLEPNSDQIIGILVARIDLNNSLYKLLLDRVGLGQTGETLIVNQDGMALNELLWYENAPVNLKINAEPAVNAAMGLEGITITADYLNNKVLAAYTHIPQMKWGFVCKQNLYELNTPIREMILNFIIIFVITGIGITFIAIRLSKTLSKPIIEMNQVSQKIQSGDYTKRNIIRSEDELGSLAISFNKMIDSTSSKIEIQKGISDISDIMIGKSSLDEFGTDLLKVLMKITGANMSAFYILNQFSTEYEHFTSIGANEEMLKAFNVNNPEGEIGNVLSEKNIFYVRNIPEDTIFKFKTITGDAIPKEIISIPIIIENIIVAIISLVNLHKFSEENYTILKLSWNSINTSYSNLISSERTIVFAEHLSKTNKELETNTKKLQSQTEVLKNTSKVLQEQNTELEAQRKNVEEANKLKSEFLSNMSHELRTPLNSIMNLSRILMKQAGNKLNDEENNYLEIVERNGKTLLSLINDILDLSKIESGKMDIKPELISIGSLLKLIGENMHSFSVEKGLSVNFHIPDKLPKVKTDETRLYQVLSNIISNALKFTEKGSVDISVIHDSENIIIEVKDTGIGISKKILPLIFEEFRQADGTTTRKYQGTGLGLAIANKTTIILGGKIQVESELGKGTVFTITIPVEWQDVNTSVQ